MSLLLDALKRAEEAKRAKQPVEAGTAPDGAPLRATAAKAADRSAESTELSLQDLEEVSPPRATVRTPGGAGAAPVAGASLAATASPGGFELESVSPPPAATRTRPGDAETARQRESAKNVFAAKQPALPASGEKRTRWLAPVIAVILVIVGGAGWYIWNEMNKFRRPILPIATRPSTAPMAPTGAKPPALPATSQPATESARPEAVATTEAALPPLLPPPAREPPAQRPSAIAEPGIPLTERQALAKSLKDAPVGQEPLLALTRTSGSNVPAVSPVLLKAYDALRSGDLRQARAIYGQVLAATPNNLDAHLGMATVAGRQGEKTLAIQHYRQALDIDPRNATAIAGLLTLTGEGGGRNETEIKTLISQYPDAALLHFSLGNLYSNDQRWVEAQQAYFEAYRLDSDAPDYVYNLAVSLDQLRQVPLARQYYQRALALREKGGGQFDKDSVIRRLQELSRDAPNAASAGTGIAPAKP